MIIQYLYLEFYDWNVVVFYIIDEAIIDEIIEYLESLECDSYLIDEIKESLLNKSTNFGYTFTNDKYNSSIVIIGPTTSGEEFQDTYDHEKGHLSTHIATKLKIDPYSEGMQYLNGAIGKAMFPVAKYLICDNCRFELIKG